MLIDFRLKAIANVASLSLSFISDFLRVWDTQRLFPLLRVVSQLWLGLKNKAMIFYNGETSAYVEFLQFYFAPLHLNYRLQNIAYPLNENSIFDKCKYIL